MLSYYLNEAIGNLSFETTSAGGTTELCDEKGRVHCDDRVHGAL